MVVKRDTRIINGKPTTCYVDMDNNEIVGPPEVIDLLKKINSGKKGLDSIEIIPKEDTGRHPIVKTKIKEEELIIEVEDNMTKEKVEKEAKELKVVLDEDVKKQQIEVENAEKKRKEEIKNIVQEVLGEIKVKEKEVKVVEKEVKEEKTEEKKDELEKLNKELADLRKEHAELLIKLTESDEVRRKNEQTMKRGLVQMFGNWKTKK